MGRTPNTKCSVCKESLYRRPGQLATAINVYCSPACRDEVSGRRERGCLACGETFKPAKATSQWCSRTCANRGRLGSSYRGRRTDLRREALVSASGKYECMIVECDYTTTLDIHRLIAGKDGGEYVEGNMFFLCPNHHAEVTRGIATLEKIAEFELRIHGRVDECAGLENQSVVKSIEGSNPSVSVGKKGYCWHPGCEWPIRSHSNDCPRHNYNFPL